MDETEKTSEANRPWYKMEASEVRSRLSTDTDSGLREEDARKRFSEYGANSLSGHRDDRLLDLILTQLKSPLIVILILSGIATIFLHEYSSSVVIFITVAVNIIIGVVQEGKAGQAFRKLADSQTRYATVVRDGVKRVIKSEELVPGDVVEVEAGNYVPADMRLFKVSGLMINEAALTGEWKSESKSIATVTMDVAVSDQTNMAFMGTSVSYGEALGIVVATGNRTQIGRIAANLSFQAAETPLQKAISRLARFLVVVVLIVLAIVIALGVIRGQTPNELLLVAIALAVSSIPEGLPVAITVILSTGMKNILKRGGFVRSMLAAETLGSTTVILTDKTGTLTKGEMIVKRVVTAGWFSGSESDDDEVVKIGVLASDAFVENKDGETVIHGRPVEKALMQAGLDRDLYQDQLLKHRPRIDFLKFESRRRYAASMHKDANESGNVIYVSGAPEQLLEQSSLVFQNGEEKPFTRELRDQFLALRDKEGERGSRLIGIAYHKTDALQFPVADEEVTGMINDRLVFAGFVILDDAIRDDVKASINKAKRAGAKVIMMTGDHLGTGLAIAREVGIASPLEDGYLGSQLEDMTDKELLGVLKRSHVFARMLPEQKLRVAKLLKREGEVVAMTGDGVNDAPALRNASIGIALGSGTEVAKEASDLVLVNNSFSIIVYAIEEGRRLLDNIKKSVALLLSTNFSEIFMVAGAMIMGMSLPLLPKQILWENIVSGGLLNIIFAFEPAEEDVMNRDPGESNMRRIMTPRVRAFSIAASILAGGTSLALFWYLINIVGMPLIEAQTVVFVMVSIDIMFLVFSFKDFHKPIWRISLFSNRYIFLALLVTVFGIGIALFVPPLANLLSVSLPANFPYLIVLFTGIFDLAIVEVAKWLIFKPDRA